ncbi:MAG: transposase [Candidatus Komeilibacteria bacterium]
MYLDLPQRKANRLKGYDYSQPGYYFITINTANYENFFGKVINGRMQLNKYGWIARRNWLWLRRWHYIALDAFIIMPNHVHGIIIIKDRGQGADDFFGQSERFRTDNPRVVRTAACRRYKIYRQHMLLSKIICAFKTISSKSIHQSGLPDFAWHRSFYDHIIRHEDALIEIREYIRQNPQNWLRDRNNRLWDEFGVFNCCKKCNYSEIPDS